ncbi:MAG: cupin domain-containing protein [Pseudomonadota bacterium]
MSIDQSDLEEGVLAAIGELLRAGARQAPQQRSIGERLRWQVLRESTRVSRLGRRSWQPLRPGISIQLLHVTPEGMASMLWRVAAGAGVPAHYHERADECLVLSGSIQVGATVLSPGDFIVGRRGEMHPEIHAPNGAVVYLRAPFG